MDPRGTHYPKPSPSCSPQRREGEEPRTGHRASIPLLPRDQGVWEPSGPWQRGEPGHAMPSRQREPHSIPDLALSPLSTHPVLPQSSKSHSRLNPSKPQTPSASHFRALLPFSPSSFFLFHPFPAHLAHPCFHPIASAGFQPGELEMASLFPLRNPVLN